MAKEQTPPELEEETKGGQDVDPNTPDPEENKGDGVEETEETTTTTEPYKTFTSEEDYLQAIEEAANKKATEIVSKKIGKEKYKNKGKETTEPKPEDGETSDGKELEEPETKEPEQEEQTDQAAKVAELEAELERIKGEKDLDILKAKGINEVNAKLILNGVNAGLIENVDDYLTDNPQLITSGHRPRKTVNPEAGAAKEKTPQEKYYEERGFTAKS